MKVIFLAKIARTLPAIPSLCVDVTCFHKPGPNTIRLAPFAPKSARLVVY
ncbi:MAG: hypothetical protein WCP35_04390 [Verrucomicrobiota bacterium]